MARLIRVSENGTRNPGVPRPAARWNGRKERWFFIHYVNAEEILPASLLEEIRRYFEGGAIYVPRSEGRAGWGTGSGMRAELDERNRAIRLAFDGGAKISEIADRFCLSPDSIRKILQKT